MTFDGNADGNARFLDATTTVTPAFEIIAPTLEDRRRAAELVRQLVSAPLGYARINAARPLGSMSRRSSGPHSIGLAPPRIEGRLPVRSGTAWATPTRPKGRPVAIRQDR